MPQKKTIDDQAVLEKALLVISTVGPEKFTLADIGKAVGLAPATLVQRFGSKQKLLVLAAEQANTKLKTDLEALKKQKLPWNQELMQILIAIPEGFGTREEIANSLGVLKLDMIDKDLHPIARHLFEIMRKRIQELLLAGRVASKFNVNEITWELDALRHGLVIQWTLSGTGTLQKWLENGFKKYFERMKT